MIYVANGAPSARRLAQNVIAAAIAPGLINSPATFDFPGTPEEYKETLSPWALSRNGEAQVAVAEALGLKLHWLVEHRAPTQRVNLFGVPGTYVDMRYRHAVCNALADIVRDTKIIHEWREGRLYGGGKKTSGNKRGPYLARGRVGATETD